MTDTKKNIYQRISAIQGEVTKVDKSAQVQAGGGSYRAVTHDDVTKMLRPLMVKHGVVSVCRLVSVDSHDTGVIWGKRPLIQTRGKFEIDYVNIDNPEEVVCVPVFAYADDNGDKGPGKVTSYAQKYADMKLFRIQTGEDDEQRVDESKLSSKAEAPLTEAHALALYKAAEDAFGDDAGAELDKLAKLLFRVEGYANIEDRHFDVALQNLKNRAAARDE